MSIDRCPVLLVPTPNLIRVGPVHALSVSQHVTSPTIIETPMRMHIYKVIPSP